MGAWHSTIAMAFAALMGQSAGQPIPHPQPTQEPVAQSPRASDLSPPAPDPKIAQAGSCYWDTLGERGQDALYTWVMKYDFENAMRFGLTLMPQCDPNFKRHLRESIWVARARVMWEVSLRALSADHFTEQSLREHLDPRLRADLLNGAHHLWTDDSDAIRMGDFGFVGVAPNLTKHQQDVARYARYYYIGRAIEQVTIERTGGGDAHLL